MGGHIHNPCSIKWDSCLSAHLPTFLASGLDHPVSLNLTARSYHLFSRLPRQNTRHPVYVTLKLLLHPTQQQPPSRLHLLFAHLKANALYGSTTFTFCLGWCCHFHLQQSSLACSTCIYLELSIFSPLYYLYHICHRGTLASLSICALGPLRFDPISKLQFDLWPIHPSKWLNLLLRIPVLKRE